MNKYPRIDCHTHILPRRLPDLEGKYGYGGWIKIEPCGPQTARMYQNGKFFREIQCNCWDAEKRLEECQRDNVEVQVLSTVPVMFSYWAKPEDALDVSRILNDDLAAVVKEHPDRFVGLGTIPMQAPELAIQELRRCMLELGFAGIQIGTHVNDWNLDAPELFPIFQEAEKLGAAIFVHPWDMPKARMKEYWMEWLVGMPMETTTAITTVLMGGVLKRLPNLRMCFAHGGGSFPGTLGRIEHGWKVRPDLCQTKDDTNPRDYGGKYWCDSLVHDMNALSLLIKTVGSNRIVLGTDYPFPLGEDRPGELIVSAEIDEETKKKMLFDNAMEFLGLEKDYFEKKKVEKMERLKQSQFDSDEASELEESQPLPPSKKARTDQ